MYVLVNIGCIECGVSSNIVGVFADEKEAEAVAEILQDKMDWREGGDNSYEVFPLPDPGLINEEYREALNDTE